jgi:hypothetical protein
VVEIREGLSRWWQDRFLMPVGPVVAGLLLDGGSPVRPAGVYAAALTGLAVVVTVTEAIRLPPAH